MQTNTLIQTTLNKSSENANTENYASEILVQQLHSTCEQTQTGEVSFLQS